MIVLATGSADSTAAPSTFFARWVHHATWPEWSPDTAWVRLDGPAAAGTRGTLKPKGGPRIRFVISACEPDREYTDRASLPGAKLTFQHTVEPSDGGSTLGVRVWLEGPLARIWARVMGGSFRESAQADLDRLVRLAEATPVEDPGAVRP